MKTKLLVVFALLAVPITVLASPCPTTTYDQIISGGACTIADKTFGNWFYTSSATGGATKVNAGDIAFTPLPTANNPGVLFSFGFGVGPNQVQDETFAFTVTVPTGKAPITDLHLLMLGAGFTGTGSASIAESACLGDLFSDGCAHGTVISLTTFDNSTQTKLSDTATFAPVTVIDVIKDLELTGGTDGTAVVSAVENHFSEGQTPEPGTLGLVGVGVVSLGVILRRRLQNRI
jgi:hypothetical protein